MYVLAIMMTTMSPALLFLYALPLHACELPLVHTKSYKSYDFGYIHDPTRPCKPYSELIKGALSTLPAFVKNMKLTAYFDHHEKHIFNGTSSLMCLYLPRNNLDHLYAKMFSDLSGLTELDLSYNSVR